MRVSDDQGSVLVQQRDEVYAMSAKLSELDEADATLDRAKAAIASLKKAKTLFVD